MYSLLTLPSLKNFRPQSFSTPPRTHTHTPAPPLPFPTSSERVRHVLMVNKVDRAMLELQLGPEDLFQVRI